MARGKSKNKLQSAEKVSALLKGDEDALAEQAEKGGNAKPPEKKPYPEDRPLPESNVIPFEADVNWPAAAEALGMSEEELKKAVAQLGVVQKGEEPPTEAQVAKAEKPKTPESDWMDRHGPGFWRMFAREHRGHGAGKAFIAGGAISAASGGSIEDTLNDPKKLKKMLAAAKAAQNAKGSSGPASTPAPSK